MIARLVNMLRRRRARDLAIVAAVVALGGAALVDALRDRTAEEARDGRAAAAATTDEREASATTAEEAQAGQIPPRRRMRSSRRCPGCRAGPRRVSSPSPPPAAASFAPSTSARAECFNIPRLETNCALYAPRVGTRVAYSVHDDWGSSKRHFSILDLEHPRASFGDYLGESDPAWSPDGSALAWCDGCGPGSSSRADSGRSVLTSAR